jgi:D-tyrosyl-tRNA(Tyr) deacylase
VNTSDREPQATWIADKLARLRIFNDDAGQMNRSVMDVGGEVLVVSQFTLYGDVRRGRRPSFVDAARPEAAEPLVEAVIGALRGAGVPTSSGVFGAHMDVELTNDGPVTLMIETAKI